MRAIMGQNVSQRTECPLNDTQAEGSKLEMPAKKKKEDSNSDGRWQTSNDLALGGDAACPLLWRRVAVFPGLGLVWEH